MRAINLKSGFLSFFQSIDEVLVSMAYIVFFLVNDIIYFWSPYFFSCFSGIWAFQSFRKLYKLNIFSELFDMKRGIVVIVSSIKIIKSLIYVCNLNIKFWGNSRILSIKDFYLNSRELIFRWYSLSNRST